MKLDRTPFIIRASKIEIDLILKQVKSIDIPLNIILKLLNPLRIDLDNCCWFRSDDWSNYTQVNKIQAHRLSYHIFNGIKPPKNREVCHNCDRPGCFNYDHLFLGTHGDNMRDAKNKYRVFSINLKR